MSTLEAVLLFGGGTLGLVLVISFLVVAPSVMRGARQHPSGDVWSEPLWFGGPTGELDEGGSTQRRQLEAAPAGRGGQAEGTGVGEQSSVGGAGARW